MNIRKLTIRSTLAGIALVLTISSASALFLLTHNTAQQTFPNAAGLTSGCSSLLASPVSNNGTSGGHEAFTYSYSCGPAFTGPDVATASSQGIFSVSVSGNYKPTFNFAVTGANVTSVTLTLHIANTQGNAVFCTLSPITLTSGTFVALTAFGSTYVCLNGSSQGQINTLWYDTTIVVSTFGTVVVPAYTIVWNSS